ncbi:unnamed protein product [Mytilus coruscus]|uniref:LRRNT domain-containing protein n=1 Tax=Mytilus coruscus TaxID=42192 RepID=A0A6J8D2G5_MYTCO|nr:unnamed protein product [Mytilus coruscus]
MRSSLRTMRVLIYIYVINSCMKICQTGPCKFDVRCQCRKAKNRYVEVNCSSKKITRIPNLLESTVLLNVSHNLIDSISKELLKAANHLLVLDLSFNRLSSINITTFTGLMKLRYLSLDNNKLEYNDHIFPEGIFKPLKSLSHLSLKNNNYYSMHPDRNFPDKTISDLSELETLELDVTGKYFGEGFDKLLNLKSLILGNRDFFSMSNTTFSNTRNLQNIVLHGIEKVKFRKGSFRKLRYLKHLEISFNSKLGGMISPVEDIAEDFKFTSIETLKLGQTSISLPKFPLCILNNELYTTNITEIYITDHRRKAGHFPVSIGPTPPTLRIFGFIEQWSHSIYN